MHKYLSTYAEPFIQTMVLPEPDAFKALLVVPVFDESLESLLPFLSHKASRAFALIWVFNCPDNASSDEKIRTCEVKDTLIQRLAMREITGGVYCAPFGSSQVLYLLDFCSSGKELPAKQGVGLARKLGMDFALSLVARVARRYDYLIPWLHSSDADVRLPSGYFDIPAPDSQSAAVLYPFRHDAESGYEQAMALYDLSLRYYVERLNWAGSPYAFHTIGSLIAVTPLAYAQVRGIPKRSGAEDFYLLNKLAKVGHVKSLDQPVITVAGRPSHRVPFGTGPALQKIKSMTDPLTDYTFYHPEIFFALKQLLLTVAEAEQSFSSADIMFGQLRDRMPVAMAEQVIGTLKLLKLEKQYQHLGQKTDSTQFIQAFHTWFDAFVTLRFIHTMRDLAYPNVTLETLKKSGVNFECYQRAGVLGI